MSGPTPAGSSLSDMRQRSVDGRGLADIRLLQVEDGPGRGQRLLVIRNALGIGFEIALDRGFDISSATWRGINVGWNSANGLPWPPNSVDAEEGVGFYRNFDGFIVTCGLDHIGGARREHADHYLHKHRREVFHPLHGRISSQRASLCGHGIDWNQPNPVIWAEAIVRQSAVFGENLVVHRRIALEVFGDTIRLADSVENRGFRPTPHAILYHVNFGYPFLDRDIQLAGDLDPASVSAFNTEDKSPHPDFVDYYQAVPLLPNNPSTSVELRNDALAGGLCMRLSFSDQALPAFGLWRAYQSGIYALALEPARPPNSDGPVILAPGGIAKYDIQVSFGPSKLD